MSRSLVVSGAIELQMDALAERIAQRVVELLSLQVVQVQPKPAGGAGAPAPAGNDIYERTGDPDPRATDPGGFPVGRDHPYDPTTPEELT